MFLNSKDFLDRITIEHGPRDLLTRYFLATAEAAASRDIHFDFGTFDELMEVNQANSDSWSPITTTFRPCLGGASEDNGIVIFGRRPSGQVVSCQAARLYDWHESNFKIEAEALRLFYAEPEAAKELGESCDVPSTEAEKLSGRISYCGGLWIHPSARGNGALQLVSTLARVTSYAFWGSDYITTLSTPPNMKKDFAKRNGFYFNPTSPVIMRNSPSLPGADLNMTLLYKTPDQMMQYVFTMTQNLAAQVDRAVEERRA
ncbi:MAG: hypothetical protein AAF346_07760 [Pseudomonadota bacterium]